MPQDRTFLQPSTPYPLPPTDGIALGDGSQRGPESPPSEEVERGTNPMHIRPPSRPLALT